jgi:hypothetical protein
MTPIDPPHERPWIQDLVDNLNRNVMASTQEREPPGPWGVIEWQGRTFAVSPDWSDVREHRGEHGWRYVDTKRVLDWLRTARS